MTHIARIAFCGVRRLKEFREDENVFFKKWLEKREWCNFTNVNIFIGVNGGGKSTVLELIDALRQPNRFVSLPRENKKRDRLTAFQIDFENGKEILCVAYSHKVRQRPTAANVGDEFDEAQYIQIVGRNRGMPIFSYDKNLSKTEIDEASKTEMLSHFSKLGCNVEYWSPDLPCVNSQLVSILNDAAPYLPGVVSPLFKPETTEQESLIWPEKLAAPFRLHDNNRVAIWLSDDLGQPNNVHVDVLPAGWRRLASILHWLSDVPEGSVCLIEEPETHLHPKLQRYLAQKIDEVAEHRSLQMFMTTHSTVFQQSNTWKGVPKIFDAIGADLREMNCSWSVMDALGIRNSDISQSNGIIWVEGPSDRMYIKHWLHLFCKLYQKTEPKENIDYSFCFYGGALLSHMSAAEEDSLISMLKMNRNMIVVMDRDFDFSFNPDGVLIVQNSSSPKVRILNELKQLFPARLKVWITDGYTMESYLPASFRSKYFAEVDGRLFLHKGRKVEIASKYMKRYLELGSCTESIEALTTHIEMLHTVINQWNL